MSDATLYPRYVDVFTKKVDQQEDDPDSGDIIWAEHVNKLQNAVIALETAIGPLTDVAGKAPGVTQDGTHFEYGPRTWVGPELPSWAPENSIHFDTDDYASEEWKKISSATVLSVGESDGYELIDGISPYAITISETDATAGCALFLTNSGINPVPITFQSTLISKENWIPTVIYPGEDITFKYNGKMWRRASS